MNRIVVKRLQDLILLNSRLSIKRKIVGNNIVSLWKQLWSDEKAFRQTVMKYLDSERYVPPLFFFLMTNEFLFVLKKNYLAQYSQLIKTPSWTNANFRSHVFGKNYLLLVLLALPFL